MAYDPNLTEWRFVLCDRLGFPLSYLDQFAKERHFDFKLNRPSALTFKVPSDEPLVNLSYTDAHGNVAPYLSAMDRTIRCWRKESGAWVPRYTGIVWSLDDASDDDVGYSTVQCFDAFKFFSKRLVRDPDTGLLYSAADTTQQTVYYPSADIGASIYGMISKSFDGAGPLYVDYSSGPWTVGTTVTPPDYNLQYLDQAMVDFFDTGAADLELLPVRSTGGVLSTLAIVDRLGSDKSASVRFAYDTGNYGAQSWARTLDGEALANDIHNYSGDQTRKSSTASDSSSQDRYGTMERANVLTAIHSQGVLDDLTAWELRTSKAPQDLVSFTPRPELQPVLWNDYFLGDTVGIASSSNVREAISGAQRVYGVGLDLSDDGFEQVSSLTVSLNQE